MESVTAAAETADNCLPSVESLPDGFVESSADPSPPLPSTFKESIDNESSAIVVDGFDAITAAPTDFITRDEEDDRGGDAGISKTSVASKDVVLGKKLGDDQPEVETVAVAVEEDSKGDRREESHNLTSEAKGQSEQSSTVKESTEAKKKVAKRSMKSEKELLEFTLNYQKVVAERDAAVAVRERLESLCRELQRQNKILMDECQRVSTEGQNMRQDLSTKFNDAIKDITKKLEEQKEECLGQLRENEMLRNKLKHLADQYALCEQQFAQKLKQKILELQLADLKLQQQEEMSAQEKTQMQLYAEQVSQLMETEKSLRLQLAADGERFQQFQDALSKSNEVFEAFKQEMEKMAKLVKDFKKENEFLKGKCEKSDIAIVKLVEEREHMKKQLEKVKNQKDKLESLCRSLQAERKSSSTDSAKEDS